MKVNLEKLPEAYNCHEKHRNSSRSIYKKVLLHFIKKKKQHSTALYSSILLGFMGCRIFVLCDDSLGTLTTCQPCGDVGTKHNVVIQFFTFLHTKHTQTSGRLQLAPKTPHTDVHYIGRGMGYLCC